MMWSLRWILALALTFLPLAEASAASGLTQITTKDAAGTSRSFTVLSSDGTLSGNLSATQVICDLTTPTQCATVDSSGNLHVVGTGVAQGSTTSGQTQSLIGCAVTTAAPAYTNAQTSPCSLDPAGNLRINAIAWAGTTLGAPSNFGTSPGAVAVPGVNASLYVGSTIIDSNSGNKSAASPRFVMATDQLALATWGHGATGATAPTSAAEQGCIAQSAEATAVTAGQMGGVACDLVKKQIMLPFANPENFVMGTTAAITDTTSTSVIASAGASTRNYLTNCMVTNSSTTVGTFVKILDGASIIWEAWAAAGGGFAVPWVVPLKGTAATAVNAQAVTTGANFIVSCSGYKGI